MSCTTCSDKSPILHDLFQSFCFHTHIPHPMTHTHTYAVNFPFFCCYGQICPRVGVFLFFHFTAVLDWNISSAAMLSGLPFTFSSLTHIPCHCWGEVNITERSVQEWSFGRPGFIQLCSDWSRLRVDRISIMQIPAKNVFVCIYCLFCDRGLLPVLHCTTRAISAVWRYFVRFLPSVCFLIPHL